MGKPVRGGQGLSNNGDVQGWPQEPRKGGSAGISPSSPSHGATPVGTCVIPRWRGSGEECQVSCRLSCCQVSCRPSCCLPPRSKVQGGLGGSGAAGAAQSGQICPSCSLLQRKTRAVCRGGIIHAGKEERSLSAEPSCWESGGEGGGGRAGVRADSSARRSPKAVRLISCSSRTDTCAPFPTRR